MSNNKELIISFCSFLMPEVSHIIKNGDYPDVKLLGFQANCNENSITPKKISAMISDSKFPKSDIFVIVSNCYSKNKNDFRNKNISVFYLEQCFELIINREIVLHYISKGYYIITSGWLRTYKKSIQSWGFDKDTAKTFFQESMKGILLLDTKIPGDYMPNLIKLSEYMGLSYEILPVGLSHCKLYIDSMVFSWRSEIERRSSNEKISAISEQSANYSVIFNQLETLVNLTDEKEIIQVGFELLNILFAPSNLKFNRIINNTEEEFEFKGIFNNQLEKDDGFEIEIKHSNKLLGIFKICGIQFPKFLNQYKKTGVLISQIFGLSIANARKYRTTIEQKEKIESYSTELQKINRSKDKFFSILAHDLKGPFNSLIGFSELLINEIQNKDFENIEEYTHIIHQTSNQTFNLLVNLLEWSRSQTGKIEFNPDSFNLANLIDEIISLLKYSAGKKKIKLTTNIPHDLKVFADKNMLKTVLRNLVSNSIKYTKENGSITVSSTDHKNATQISISDTGIGINKENLEKLFLIENTISMSGTNNEKGTGLGLILCKEFIEKHKGKIWVESEVEKGSVFHFTLPKKY